MVGAQDRDESVGVKNTTRQGDLTELEVMTALVRQGKTVLRPLSSATRYDLLVDNEDGTFTRIQCKTGRLRDGCIRFATYSVSGHNTLGRKYQGQVDAFGVYSPETRRTYLVPISALSSDASIGYLRVSPARNGQKRFIRPAEQFEIDARGSEAHWPGSLRQLALSPSRTV